jgi:hypothetical protein
MVRAFLCGPPSRTHINTELRKAHAILYHPYGFLDHPSSASEYPGSQRISVIESLIASGRFWEARHASYQLIKTTLSGLRYLETYDRTLIRTIVTFAYTGWIAFSATFILAPSRSPPAASYHTPLWIPSLFGLATAGSCVLFAMQRLPWTLHLYVLFPFFFWQDVTRKVNANWSAVRYSKLDANWIMNTLLGFLLAVTVLQSMVVRFFKPHPCRYEILSERREVWVHQSSRLECRLCRYGYWLASGILARRQRKALLAMGYLVRHYCSVPTAFCGSLREPRHHVRDQH